MRTCRGRGEGTAHLQSLARFTVLGGALLGLLAVGCGRERVVEMERERLFFVPIGEGMEQIGVARNHGGAFQGPEHIFFKNGFFFVVDTVNQKIMKVTTLGDIILVIAKGEPQQDSAQEEVLRTKVRRTYPFQQIGHLAVDGANNIYVENKTLVREEDEEVVDLIGMEGEHGDSREVYRCRVVKFDRLGAYQYRIGRNGRDSEPFDYIYRMQVDREGNLVVITSNEQWSSWTYHAFDQQGTLLMRREIRDEQIVQEEGEQRAAFILDVVPPVEERQLVYWVSMYETSHDSEDVRREGRWGEEIAIENMDELRQDEGQAGGQMNDLLFYKLLYLELPSLSVRHTHVWETGRKDPSDTTQEFVGIDGNANGFLWKYVDQNRSIVTIFRPDGSVVARRSFVFDGDGLWTNVHVSEDGSVTAVKIDNRRVHFYRWRSDRLLEGTSEERTFWELLREKYREFTHANR
ncbi:MAG: LIC_12708 family protein [Spirochaetota bacterium]